MSRPEDSLDERGLDGRARTLVGHASVHVRRPPSGGTPTPEEPADLRALFAVSDGMELADGTRILAREEIARATAWLVGEKALSWGADLWVVGERDDLVLVRDLDLENARAGGGLLEAPTDGLSRFARAAMDLVGYLEERLGLAAPSDDHRAPERAARDAAARKDEAALVRVLARPFFPGAERDAVHAATALGALRAARGDADGALEAFTIAVDARARAATRGAEASETRAGWKACAIAAERARAPSIADACRARAI